MPPAIIAAGIGVAGSIGGAALAGSASKNAANTQANAALQAAQLQHQDAQAALGFQQQQFNTSQQEIAPWLQQGSAGLANLSYLLGLPVNGNYFVPGQGGPIQAGGAQAGGNLSSMMDPETGRKIVGVPGTAGAPAQGKGAVTSSLASLINPNLGAQGSLMKPFGEQFQAPTNVTEQNDPGYQFRLQQGMQALERSASARGNLLSGGTGKALERYGQDYASNEYGNVYNRAFNEYANRYNQYQTNQANQFNRLASLSGVGQTAANQLGYLGQGAAQNVGNILMTSGNQIGQNINNAGAARASGYVGGANAWQGALGNIGQLAMLYGMQNQPSPVTGLPPTPEGWNPASAIPQGIFG